MVIAGKITSKTDFTQLTPGEKKAYGPIQCMRKYSSLRIVTIDFCGGKLRLNIKV